MPFPFYKQLNEMDCGPTCLRMITKHYGKHYNADTLRRHSGFNKSGVNLLGISETAEKLGFTTQGAKIPFEKLLTAPLPAVLHWEQNHFVVLIALNNRSARVADPAQGIMSYSLEAFKAHWMPHDINANETTGTALLLEPGPAFYEKPGEKEQKLSWTIISGYLRQSRKQLLFVFLSLVITSALTLVLPYLTKGVVDTGIRTRDLNFVTLMLFAQLMLSLGSAMVELVRGRLQLKISNKVNLAILSDFWAKLTRLPVSYFDSRQTGDTLQRIADNRKLQDFLTGQTMSSLFALLNFIVYSVVLIIYNIKLFIIFIIGTAAYFLWIRFFFKIRRKINDETFNVLAKENNATLQLVQGMQEIRLNNAEKFKRWDWQNIQAAVFKLNYKSLTYAQWQSTGALFINQGKDILISFTAAQLVINGELSLGTMLAVQFIIGQLNGPVSQFTGLSQSIQDARISMERLNDIHQLADEEPAESTLLQYLPPDKSIVFHNVSFAYTGSGDDPVITSINLEIPEGKTTAVVGVSGSGKTTLLKLLLKIFDNYTGEIKVGGTDLKSISHHFWRSQCGAVMQDGFIFNDSIARNIAVGDEKIDEDLLIESCRIANILTYVQGLPNGFSTKLGTEGVGLSQGQRQRILVARTVYKQPAYLFFDEATSALDANNEKIIVEQLNQFALGRTMVVIAHRLSTVKNADKIIVVHNGGIAEEGSHASLTAVKGHYYELVKNQLELGN
jgi:ATP-binding cassette subfamily B protein